MSVLVDTSVWIDFFRGTPHSDDLEFLIEENLAVTNDLILSELIPPLSIRKQTRLIALLRDLKRYEVVPDWEDLIQMQTVLLRKGINAVGLPDLMIGQNAIRNGLPLLSRDKHFALISLHLPLSLYGDQ